MNPAVAARRLRRRRLGVVLALGIIIAFAVVALQSAGAHADPIAPTPPVTPAPPTTGGTSITINGIDGTPSQTVLTLIGITLLSVAPALLMMTTSFTKVFVVLSMTRNALGLTAVPPNQVIAGLALFLSLFIMWPVLTDINTTRCSPTCTGPSISRTRSTWHRNRSKRGC